MRRILVYVCIFTLISKEGSLAQSSNREATIGELQRQLQEIRSQMTKMQARIDELETANGLRGKNSGTDPTPEAVIPPRKGLASQGGEMKRSEGSILFQSNRTTLTLGGFLDAASLFRARNENADIANSYTLIPLNGSSNSKLSEFRGSVRGSQLSLLIQGAEIRGTKLKGYVETDFLGAAPTANYVASNSWTPRLRQLWVELDRPSGLSINIGQMWSLLTTNRKGLATLAELKPIGEEGNYSVGFTWTRSSGVRVTRNLNNKVWVAFAVENPGMLYSAAFVPSNIMGLNTSQNAATGVNLLPFLSNYSNGQSTDLAPDLLAKLAFEPGWGHFEIKALGRLFRDRIASTATTKGHTNSIEGYGVGFGALMPFANKAWEVSLEGLLGQGIGRYASSGLPDVTINPTTGGLRPLRQAWILGGLIHHPSSHLELYAYGGDDYTGRYAFVSPDGNAAGYGSPLGDYTKCTNEIALNVCNGANRNIYEGTAGYWYRLYRGEYGRIEYGNQLVYMHRNLWSGIGKTPQGGDTVVYSSIRFYLP
jgi:hypothetical protein